MGKNETNQTAEQPKTVQSAPTTKLYGQPAMTSDEKAAFLAKARQDEANYNKENYLREHDNENRFFDPKHRMNTLPPLVNSDKEKQRILGEMINYQLDTGHLINGRMIDGQFSLQNNLRDYAAVHTHAAATSAATKQYPEQAPSKSSAWYQQAGKATNESPIPNASIANTSSSVSTHATSAPFKPYIAPELKGSEVLYTNDTQSAPSKSSAWYNNAGKAANGNPVPQAYISKVSAQAAHNIDSSVLPKHTGKIAAALGLMAAAETAAANTNGTITEKLTAAGNVLKNQGIDQIPFVTYGKTIAEATKTGSQQKFHEAMLDAAGYLPMGDATGIARSPQVQTVIDALPKDKAALEKMQGDNTLAPINRHLAETQLAFMQAKAQGEIFRGLAISNHLTELAEQKIVLQSQWQAQAEKFVKVIAQDNVMLATFAKSHPDIAPHINIHLAAIRSGYPDIVVHQIDQNLSNHLASGTPISRQMMEFTKHVNTSERNAEIAQALK